jgi:hypothetical protein
MMQQYGSLVARQDRTSHKVTALECHVEQLKKQLDDANDYKKQQWTQFGPRWEAMEALIKKLANQPDDPPRIPE